MVQCSGAATFLAEMMERKGSYSIYIRVSPISDWNMSKALYDVAKAFSVKIAEIMERTKEIVRTEISHVYPVCKIKALVQGKKAAVMWAAHSKPFP
ncbi:MAG: hypothetical protein R2941_09420 [Desulfobacterales bacterium]